MTGVVTLVSVTRFHLRSVRFMPFFMLHANRTIAQIRRADGFVAGAIQRDANQTFWTLTIWRNELSMRAFGASGAHRRAMPHLSEWADEASLTHWMQSGAGLPDWPEAARRLRDSGKPSFVRHPQARPSEGDFADPRMTCGMRL